MLSKSRSTNWSVVKKSFKKTASDSLKRKYASVHLDTPRKSKYAKKHMGDILLAKKLAENEEENYENLSSFHEEIREQCLVDLFQQRKGTFRSSKIDQETSLEALLMFDSGSILDFIFPDSFGNRWNVEDDDVSGIFDCFQEYKNISKEEDKENRVSQWGVPLTVSPLVCALSELSFE